MPLGIALMLCAADIAWAGEAPPLRRVPLPAPAMNAADLLHRPDPLPPAVARGEPDQDHRLRRPTATADIVMTLGERRRGGQLELGALGGGRWDAPGLVHLGIGFDF